MEKPAEKKIRIFISYSHRDRDTCARIAAIMRSEPSFDVWYDDGLIPGELYRRKIVDTICGADYFVILISGSSVQSEWVLDEVEYAKKQHKRILPIWIEQTDLPGDLDMMLNRYHSLFWYLRASDRQFEGSLFSILRPEEADEEQGRAQVGFGNEYAESVNLQMSQLLEDERQEHFAKCSRPENAVLLGMAYLDGGPCAISREKAAYYFKVAAYFGNPDAEFYQLRMKMEDQEADTWDDPDEAFSAPIVSRIRELADGGCVPAKLYMGNIYWYGKYGCPVDIAASTALYEACAKEGNARAQYMMAANYYYGDGVPKDYDLARMYANLALEQKYIKAWRRWGKFYRDGLAVPQDYQKARECYEKGAETGDYNCYNKVGDMLYFGWGFPVDYDEAWQYYLKGEQAPVCGQKYGLRKAKEALGRCLENGHGTAMDIAAAADKYLEGYRYGSPECKEGYLRCSRQLKGEQ